MLNFILNKERCIQCGKCGADCPARCIAMKKGDYPSIPDEDKCMRCQHCLAICPTGAISIMGVNPDECLELNYQLPTAHSMETLIKGRRSTRRYKKQGLEEKTIEKLLQTAWHAPTGSNTQSVLFTATLNPEATEALRKELYTRLEDKLAAQTPDENDFRLDYMRGAFGMYKEHGIEPFMGSAPHILIASAPKSLPLRREDSLIALTTCELMAQSMGVGTVWLGLLTWCLTDFFPDLATKLGVPGDHEIGYCMAFGKPAAQYHRTVQRSPAKVNLVKSF